MNGTDTFEKVILGEIEGKNAAIHAYDGIIWKVRTGFLTLFFVGWAALLKGVIESPASLSRFQNIVEAMVIISLGLATCGWVVDRNYLQRKFRVVLALNQLLEFLDRHPEDHRSVPAELLILSGDKPEMPHSCPGYNEASATGAAIFFLPLVTVVAAAFVLLS